MRAKAREQLARNPLYLQPGWVAPSGSGALTFGGSPADTIDSTLKRGVQYWRAESIVDTVVTPHVRNLSGRGANSMSNIVVDSVIGPDGTLHLDVPIGIENANQPVRVVIEAARKTMTRAEWGGFVRSMAGSITDPTFERPAQLPLEAREPLS
jgi:hypothetical protein